MAIVIYTTRMYFGGYYFIVVAFFNMHCMIIIS
jgi:hypothetical protein